MPRAGGQDEAEKAAPIPGERGGASRVTMVRGGETFPLPPFQFYFNMALFIIHLASNRVNLMKVFISWSGDTARKIALELYEWLPMVLQSIEPYMSEQSIEKGTRWVTNVAEQLQDSVAGIVILTPDSLNAPWLNFEAGALSRVVDQSAKLAPVLFGMKPSDVIAPLSQFQVTEFNSNEFLNLLKSINAVAESDGLPEQRLEKAHHALWNNLEEKINPIIAEISSATDTPAKKKNVNQDEILEEILVYSRRQLSILTSSDLLYNPDIIKMIIDIFNEKDSNSKTRIFYHLFRELFIIWDNVITGQFRNAEIDKETVMIDIDSAQRIDSYIREMAKFVYIPKAGRTSRSRDTAVRGMETGQLLNASARSPDKA